MGFSNFYVFTSLHYSTKKMILLSLHNLHTARWVAGLGFSCSLIIVSLDSVITPSSMIRWPHLAYKSPHSLLFPAITFIILFPVSFAGFCISLWFSLLWSWSSIFDVLILYLHSLPWRSHPNAGLIITCLDSISNVCL